ncbi:cupin domain-containing protein [Pedobacter psychrodurus]|uniref:Cupin domain-containing protein n=1 Tax=Pedobacter psychrodurus TaxID=2530456 RepID=A0A4R0PZU2_9SPHI|nr:cupin domain-containing protein [Pedobacter psychrodurus]TCD28781.1 cupin domain-containing protein [Pedobacter psychrodurus]
MERKEFLLGSLSIAAFLTLNKTGYAENGDKEPFIVKSGKGRFGESFLYKGKNPNDIKISGKDTNGQLAVFEYIGYEKTGPSLHIHFDQDEIFYVAEGNYKFSVDGKLMELASGDTIFLPRNIPHTWIQRTDFGKLIYFVQPAGKAEEFFRTMNNFGHKPSKAEVDKIHADCGMKVIGPGLTID